MTSETPLQITLHRHAPHFMTAVFRGDHAFDEFLARGGSPTEEGAAAYLKDFLNDPNGLQFQITGMGCSTMQAAGKDGFFFGRNFDWEPCPLLVVTAYPASGYASISSVNTDFVTKRNGQLPDDQLVFASLYAPLDGMNEKGLCVSVNLLPDGMALHQDSGKPHLTITTAIRLMLDKAATTEEALALLQAYDLSTTTGLTIHYLISDARGHSVCVEYIHNVMSVVETRVMTNHYLTPGPYFGQARSNSPERYDRLAAFLAEHPVTDSREVLDAMAGVFHGTQWTAVFDQSALTAVFCLREDTASSLLLSI